MNVTSEYFTLAVFVTGVEDTKISEIMGTNKACCSVPHGSNIKHLAWGVRGEWLAAWSGGDKVMIASAGAAMTCIKPVWGI